MSKYWSGLIVAGVFAVTTPAVAQGQNPANVPPPDTSARPGTLPSIPPPTAQAKAGTVVVVGCVQNAPRTAGAERPARPAYILANARLTSGDRDAVGTSGSALSGTSYQLDVTDAMIAGHVNHQVRVTGMLQSSSASATGAAKASPNSTAAGQTVKVESVEMVSTTCPAANAAAPQPATPPAR